MFCQACGTHDPGQATSCMICGKPFLAMNGEANPARETRWEFKDVNLPISVVTKNSWTSSIEPAHPIYQPKKLKGMTIGEYVNSAILEEIERQGSEGWQPDGDYSFYSLFDASRFKYTCREEGFFSFSWYHTYLSVSLRFKRLTCQSRGVKESGLQSPSEPWLQIRAASLAG